MIKLKDLLTEAPKIKKVKNVSVQYMDAEYVGDVDFKPVSKAWVYKKDKPKDSYFLVVITKTKNKYEIDLGKHRNSESAKKFASGYLKRKFTSMESIKEGKGNKKIFDKIVKAMKDVKFRATIHLNTDNVISIGLGRDYFKKKNPHGKGSLEDEVYNRLKKAGVAGGPYDMRGIEIMADNSDFDDKELTKAQHDIRGGV